MRKLKVIFNPKRSRLFALSLRSESNFEPSQITLLPLPEKMLRKTASAAAEAVRYIY